MNTSRSFTGRDDKGDLEFARQIGLAIERVHEILVFVRVQIELLAVNPDGVIGLGLRRERQGHSCGVGKTCSRAGV